MAGISLTKLMKERPVLSFELFPPKTEKGMQKLPDTIAHLCEFSPDYISCTYGAGGTNVGSIHSVCGMIQNAGTLPLTHFTVIRNTREKMKAQLDRFLSEGVDHVLALRGDFPIGETSTLGDFQYASDLVSFIRSTYGDAFEIAVAGSPEGHISSPTIEHDIRALRIKQDNGANFILTQLCWDLEQFKRWQDLIDRAGITMPVDVGIMPVLNMKATITMALSRNGCVMDRELCRMISHYWVFPDPFDQNPAVPDEHREQKLADFRKAGKEYTVRQIEAYKALGVNGIHLYALNQWKDVSEIIRMAGLASR